MVDKYCSDYKYMKIRDANDSITQKVSFFGLIFEIGLPKKSKGTDYYCTLKLVDQSHHSPGIPVNFFAPRLDMLPRALSLGDIIQLSDVTMKIYQGEACATFNKHFSSFALYEGEDGVGYLPYQFSTNFRRREQDKKIIASLRKWSADVMPDEGSSDFLPLRNIKEGELMDVACKILCSLEVAQDVYIIFVWDGTDTPPCSIQAPIEEEMNNQLPLHNLPLPRDLLCTLPTVGTILRVVIDQSIQIDVLHLLKAGKWMKLLNVLFKANDGSWGGALTPETRLRYTFNKDNIIEESQRSHESRFSMKMGRMSYWCFPQPSLITDVDCAEWVPCRTLMDVLTHSEVTAKFKCVVRVVSALPWRVEDFRSPSGIYRIRLTLEDSTARLHAFIHAEDGEYFFGGYPALDVLTMKWKKLLGVALDDVGKEISGASRNPLWVQCCLKSYYIDENNCWGTRQFRIFGTKLLG
ncbi:hypothetical protein ACFE04_005262 [Oxalis oulophora]